MKLLEMKCKNCGALLKVEENAQYINCQYCNTKYKLDDEVQHIKYDDMEKSGYEFEKGRLYSMSSFDCENKGKVKKLYWKGVIKNEIRII